MPKRKAAEMTNQTITNEEFARIFRALTDDEEAEQQQQQQQQQAVVAHIPNQGSPTPFSNSRDLETDNNAVNPSPFQEEPGQNYQGFDGQTQDFSFPALNCAFTQYDNSGDQHVSPPGQVLPTTTAPSVSSSYFPPAPAPAPAGINPDILAGALQVATTATGPSAPTWPVNNTTATPFAPPHPQTFFLTAPQLTNSARLIPTTISTTAPTPTPTISNMVVLYRPPSPQPELLSEYPHLHRTHHTTGYRDGLAQGRSQTSQTGFDAGFRIGMHYGSRVGRVLGILEFALAGTTERLSHEILARAKTELEVGALVRDIEAETGIVRDGHLNPNVNVNWGMGVQNMAGNSYAAGNWNGNGNANSNAYYMGIQEAAAAAATAAGAAGTYTPPYTTMSGAPPPPQQPHHHHHHHQQQQQPPPPQIPQPQPQTQPSSTPPLPRYGPPANFLFFTFPTKPASTIPTSTPTNSRSCSQ
ncbi:hypothetical protein GJ744_011657 [Endocarpon pusillum]|uniref:Protein YAE1 n=1 Tax=Endocarpon pusillum TaxID=364733 RepID=A0A8H7AG85_9EURO|nr:hypothetical protein GJ744_011657 [Endocarpon pusillum]